MLKLCRFKALDGSPRIGALDGDSVRDLTPLGVTSLTSFLDQASPSTYLKQAEVDALTPQPLATVQLLPPVEQQEIWAAGVTYLRSKTARMEESVTNASAYDRVYAAARPEIFFKSLPSKVIGPLGPVGIRSDATWNVPEPELALVLNSRHELVGFTIGNDMSSRDIEGENVLYLPQAKIYDRSCAIGPCILVGSSEEMARTWQVSITINRAGKPVFAGETSVSQIKRSFNELIDYLCRSQRFPCGAILFTGTGVVPPDGFTLQPEDMVSITIGPIGTLTNSVMTV